MQPVRSLLARYPWWQLEPHRDWLLVGGQPNPLPTATDLTPPHCAAVPGELYLIYIPRRNASRTLTLTHLQAEDFRGHWYDPRTGEATPLVQPPTNQHDWVIPHRRSPGDEDWVLCLEKRQ
jgi:hypothetical protein